MTLTIQATALKEALSACSHVAVRHSDITALKSIKISAKGGMATFAATNNFQTIVAAIDAEGELETYLDTQMLLDRAQVLDKAPLILSQAQGMVNLAQGKAKWRLPTATINAWTEYLPMATEPVILSGSQFMAQIDQLSYAMEPEGTDRHVLQGIHIDPEGWGVATDEKQFSVVLTYLKGPYTIPRASVAIVRKLFKDAGEIEVRHDENKIQFSRDGLQFQSTLVAQQFPNWRAARPNAEPARGVVDSAQLAQAAKRVAALTLEKGRRPRIDFEAGGKRMVLTAEIGGEQNTDEIAYEGDDMRGVIHPQWLVETLGTMPEGRVELEYFDEKRRLILTSPGVEGYRLIMCMLG